MNYTELLMSYSSSKLVPKEVYPMRVYSLLKQEGFDPDSLQYIHITGSKGKGSLAHSSFELLKQQKFSVGLFSSPHIMDIRERFTTNQGMISEKEFANLIQRFHTLFQHEELHFFELCLFLALVYFIEQVCEFVVLEVGVGGRFDPTNFCKPKLVLFGNISMEHKKLLGDTIEKIAFDKAGIIKENILTLSVDQNPIVKDILMQEGEAQFFDDFITITNLSQGKTTTFDLSFSLKNISKSSSTKIINLPQIKLNRIGYAHLINFCLAVVGIYSIIDVIDDDIVYQVAQQKIPYRMDLIKEDLLIDSAHNGASFENLMKSLILMGWKDIILYLTILQEKEIDDIVSVLKKYKHLIKRIECFDFQTNAEKQSNAKELYNGLKDDISSSYIDDIYKIKIGDGLKVFVGSFYCIPMINDILKNT